MRLNAPAVAIMPKLALLPCKKIEKFSRGYVAVIKMFQWILEIMPVKPRLVLDILNFSSV